MSRFAWFLCVNLWFLKYCLRISCGVSHVWPYSVGSLKMKTPLYHLNLKGKFKGAPFHPSVMQPNTALKTLCLWNTLPNKDKKLIHQGIVLNYLKLIIQPCPVKDHLKFHHFQKTLSTTGNHWKLEVVY